jgi:hypothetical protein
VILADTSAWVEYLRATGSDVHLRVRSLIGESADLCVTEIVIMELSAGASSEERLEQLRRFLARFRLLPLGGLDDWERAASLYRSCRRAGETPRALADCLVASVAIRSGAAVLHLDRDFEVLARHTSLRLVA